MNTEIVIGSADVFTWARESLSDPMASTFSHMLSTVIDCSNARFVVLANGSIEKKELTNYRTGGKMSPPPTAAEWLRSRVLAFFSRQNGYALVSDWTARPKHTFLTDRGMPAVFHKSEVYYVVTNNEAQEQRKWGRIWSNTVPLFHAFLVAGMQPPQLGIELNSTLLEEMVPRVRAIIFGIYDGESYLLMER